MANPFAYLKTPAAHWVGSSSLIGYTWRRLSLAEALDQVGRADAVVAWCVWLMQSHVSRMPLALQDPDGGIVGVADHPIAGLLAQPNPRHKMRSLLAMMVPHMLLAGDAYLKVVWDGSRGRAAELWPLNPDRVKPVAPSTLLRGLRIADDGRSDPVISDGWVDYYEITDAAPSTPTAWPARSIVQAQDTPSPDNPHRGEPRIASIMPDVQHRQTLLRRMQTQAERGRPAGYIVRRGGFPTPASDAAVGRWTDTAAEGRIHELAAGDQFIRADISARDLESTDQQKASSIRTALLFGVLPPLLSADASTYDNMAHAIAYSIVHGAVPIAETIADAIAVRVLLPEERQDGYTIAPRVGGFPELHLARHADLEAWSKAHAAGIPLDDLAQYLEMPIPPHAGSDRAYLGASIVPMEDPDEVIRGLDAEDV